MNTSYQVFIDGVWREGSDGTRAPVINPATEEAFAEVSWGTPEDADLALEAAEKALSGEWSTWSPTRRGLGEKDYRVFDVDADFGCPEETALEGIRRLKAFYKELGLPVSLADANIPDERFEEMAAKCIEKGPVGNFMKLYKKDVVNIFTLAQ